MNQGDLIVDAVRKFLAKNKVKILFGTPCFGGMLHNGYFQSMLELSGNFTKLGIPFEVCTIGNESLIQRARNGIVAKFMSDDSATHLMFIDADITFSWVSIIKLLLGNKELSGGCYPKKCFNWDKIKHHNQKNPDMKDDELMAKSLDYVFNPIYHQQGSQVVIRLENGMAQVKDIGTGFMIIQKSVIRKMIAKYPDTKYKNNVAGYGQNNMNEYFYSLFDCCIDPVSRVYLSEDYLFCKRWIDIGGELWLDVNTNLNHTGIIDYKGCLALTIGEADVLNKDAQILRQQNEQKAAQQAKANVNVNGNKAVPMQPVTEPLKAVGTTDTQNQASNQSSKKKKNKNKNNKKYKHNNQSNNNTIAGDCSVNAEINNNNSVGNSVGVEESSSDEEEGKEVKKDLKDLKDLKNLKMEKINEQAFDGNHC